MTSQMPPQQPWGPYQQQPMPPQPPVPPQRKKHTFRNIMLSLTAALVVLIVALAALSGGGKGSGSASSQAGTTTTGNGGQGSAPAASPATVVHHHKMITYVVTGSPANVTYGAAGSDLNGQVPMRITRRLHSKAYYAISAQLQGDGSVHCAIKVNGKTISKATATGSYNIADCEISQNPLTGKWEDTNSG